MRIMLLLVALLAIGCERRADMDDQPRYDPLEYSDFFADGQSSRPIVAGTVPRGQLPPKVDPPAVTPDLLSRGQQRYDIFCSVCHGQTGEGNGMIVQRGFVRPPSFHEPRLRDAPADHFYDVITNGYGAMFSYNDRINPRDRWAIVAYIRALQLSQSATLDDVPPTMRNRLEGNER